MNKVILFGNIGKDPEIRTTESGKKLAKFSLATQSFRKDKDGNKITDWHNIVVWDKLADLCEKYVKKGSAIIVEGEITYRNYENKEGQKVYMTEIICNNLHFTGKKEGQKEAEKPDNNEGEWQGKKEVKAMSNTDELPGAVDDRSLPF